MSKRYEKRRTEDDLFLVFDTETSAAAFYGGRELVALSSREADEVAALLNQLHPTAQEPAAKEPLGKIAEAGLESDEVYQLARGIETERDA